jgi:hypothetical protein
LLPEKVIGVESICIVLKCLRNLKAFYCHSEQNEDVAAFALNYIGAGPENINYFIRNDGATYIKKILRQDTLKYGMSRWMLIELRLLQKGRKWLESYRI